MDRLSRQFSQSSLAIGRTIAFCALVLFGSSSSTFPQSLSDQTSPQQDSYEVEVDVDQVSVNVVVTDKKGRYVQGLREEHFRIYEDKVEQKVTHFFAEDAQCAIVILIDTACPVGPQVGLVRAEIVKFLQALPPGDQVLPLAFGSEVLRWKKFAETPLEELPQYWRHTRLYKAVTIALKKFQGVVGRKVLVLVSDGGVDVVAEILTRMQTRPTEKYREYAKAFSDKSVLRQVEESDLTVYTVSIPLQFRDLQRLNPFPGDQDIFFDTDKLGPLVSKGKKFLVGLAERSGGEFFPGDRFLGDVLSQIALEIHSQYTLAYVPNNKRKDGNFRKLKVEVIDVPGVKIRVRKGYFAPDP